MAELPSTVSTMNEQPLIKPTLPLVLDASPTPTEDLTDEKRPAASPLYQPLNLTSKMVEHSLEEQRDFQKECSQEQQYFEDEYESEEYSDEEKQPNSNEQSYISAHQQSYLTNSDQNDGDKASPDRNISLNIHGTLDHI